MNLEIDEKRKQRYKDKIGLALRRIEKIEEILQKFEDETIKLAVYKAFQEVSEAITDISAMLLIDNKISIEDDYSNIEKVKEILNFNDNEIEILKETNGLRNRVIHKYNKTDDKIARESINILLPDVKKTIEKIERFIENGSKTKD